jgi:hypothetical protein
VFSLSWSDRVSRVRSGNRVKMFFLSGSDRVSRVGLAGLSGLSSDMTKTSPQVSFSLIPQLGLG